MSIYVQNYVWSLDLPPTIKFVAIALADHAHNDGTEARPSQAHLVNKTGLSQATVKRALRELIERGVIRLERPAGRNRCNVYAFELGGQSEPLSVIGGSSGAVGGSLSSEWGVTEGPLIIKNLHVNQNDVSDEFRAIALANIRAVLGQTGGRR